MIRRLFFKGVKFEHHLISPFHSFLVLLVSRLVKVYIVIAVVNVAIVNPIDITIHCSNFNVYSMLTSRCIK